MRTGTFSGAEVVRRVGDTCVSAWLNKRPAMKIPDGLYKGLNWSFRPNNGAATHNLTSVLAHPDGTVLHAMPGALDEETFLEQLDFALALRDRMYVDGARRKDADEIRAAAHAKAADSVSDKVRREAHRRLAKQSFTIATLPLTCFEDLQKVYSGN